jgi:hypothetical protein
MLLTVTEMEYVKGYRLRLTFNNGVVKEIDLSAHWEHLFGSVFQPLRDPDMFAQVFLSSESETIEWPNGADLAAEFLYEPGKP